MPSRYEYVPPGMGTFGHLPEEFLDIAQTCSIRTEAFNPDLLEGDRIYHTAVVLLRWAMLQSFDGAVPSRKKLREKYTAVWKSSYYPELGQSPAPADHPTFWAGPRAAARAAARIHDFLLKYEIMHPEQPYVLKDATWNITGDYALIRKKTNAQHYVLCYHSHRPQSAPAPFACDIARYIHAFGTRESADNLGVYHLTLLRGDCWHVDRLNSIKAKEFLRGICHKLNRENTASPGPHCKTCVGKDCLRIYG